MNPFSILADDSSASAEGRFKADQQFLLKAASPGACSGFTHFYRERTVITALMKTLPRMVIMMMAIMVVMKMLPSSNGLREAPPRSK